MLRPAGENRGWSLATCVACLALLAGCVFDATLAANATIRCDGRAECPSPLACRSGFCIDPTTIDIVAPELAEPLEVSPGRGRAGTLFSVRLVSTEKLITAPQLTLHMEERAVITCTPASETLHFLCEYTATGEENHGLGGLIDFDVRLVDMSGNETVKRFAGTLQMDFRPPILAASIVSPAVARLGSTLEVFLSSSEPLSGPVQLISSVGLDEGDGGTASVFSISPEGATLNYRFTHVVTALQPPGNVAFTVSMTDEVGNVSNNLPVGSSTIDATLPELSNTSVTPARAKVNTLIEATFEVSKLLMAAPTVTLGDLHMVHDPTVLPPRYRYTHLTHALDGEGVLSVLVTGTDVAGNGFSKAIGAVTVDLTPPKLAAATAFYSPAPSNPLTSVTKATAGTLVTVSVIADEPLSTTPGPGNPPTLTATLGNSTLTFCVVGLTCTGDTRPSSYTASGVTFEVTVPPSAVDGVFVPALTWTDVAGNTGTLSFDAPALVVKTSKPMLAVAQAQVTFVRSPWGNAASENLGAFTIPSGPYFGLAPANGFDNVPTLPANTFTTTNGVIQRVRAWTTATSDTLLGTLVPNGDGTWPRQRLANLDVPTAYVTAIDEAGNESAAVKLTNAEWVATTNPAAAGANPNRLTAAAVVGPTIAQPSPLAVTNGAEGADANAILARAETAWQQIPMISSRPSEHIGHAMAYDSARGRVVMFGGAGVQDVWEWDGVGWQNKTPIGPKPRDRQSAAMVYDSARGRVVLFGGSDAAYTPLQDLWEWDGISWVDKTPSGTKPPARDSHAMAFDSRRGRVVLFGGSGVNSVPLQDLWEWDGASWVALTPTGPKPSARYFHSMVYDTQRSRLVLFGGSDGIGPKLDLWEWTGVAWEAKVPTGATPALSNLDSQAMAYDSARGRAVLVVSGVIATNVWEWNGVVWETKTAATLSPGGQIFQALAYDSARGRVVMFAGFSLSPDSGVWEWDGTDWQLKASVGPTPSGRAWHAMVYDSARARAVLFGGATRDNWTSQDVWEWDGTHWEDKTPTGTMPVARQSHAMAYDSARGRAVMFGGIDDADTPFQDVWEWDGNVWENRTPIGTKPIARQSHAMAYDSARGRVVLFGGRNGNTELQDVWEWDGVNWVDKTPTGTKPSPREGPAMAYDSTRGRVVMYGGVKDLIALADVWEWDGANWVNKTPSGTKPSARAWHAMTYDSTRNRVLMFGGFGSDEMWEWDGSNWVNRTPTGSKPNGRDLHTMVYDKAHSRAVVFGGISGISPLNEMWEWDATAPRTSALGFLVNGAGYVSPTQVSGLRVRAHCGGTFFPYGPGNIGATLYGWSTGGSSVLPGSWQPLASNHTGLNAGQPWLPLPNAALFDWSTGSSTEARQFIIERDAQLAFQCRPSGASGPGTVGSRVALDYIEVRVRYVAP